MAKIGASEKLLAEHAATITELKSEIESIKLRRKLDAFLREGDEVAYLTPGSDGYATITMDLGRVTVQIENIEGCKLMPTLNRSDPSGSSR